MSKNKKSIVEVYPESSFADLESVVNKQIGSQVNDPDYHRVIDSLRESFLKFQSMNEQDIKMELKQEVSLGGKTICVSFTSNKPSLLKRLFIR